MAAPLTPYVRGTSFTSVQAADPVSPLSGPGVDAEFDRIKLSLDSVAAALDHIQRDDGALANGSVGADQIEPAVYAGLNPADPWLTGTDYAINDSVLYSGVSSTRLYRALVAHESSVFDDDLAADYWLELADFTPPVVVGTVPIAQGGTGGVTASEARTNLGLGAAATESVVPVAKGGTGASDAATARGNLGLGIGAQVQAYDSVLDAMAGLGWAADTMLYATAADAFAVTGLSAFARTLLDDADAAAARSTMAVMKGNQTTVTDWNDALKDGHYYAAGTAANVPSAHAYVGLVTRFDDSNIVQLLLRLDTEAVWIRRRLAGTFGSWTQVALRPLTLATMQSATGSVVSFSIPTGMQEITVMFDGVSLSGTDDVLVQIGDSGGFETTGYLSGSSAAVSGVSSTSGFIVLAADAALGVSGSMSLRLMDPATFKWVESHGTTGPAVAAGGGRKALSAELTQVRVTVTGANSFDAGTINVSYR